MRRTLIACVVACLPAAAVAGPGQLPILGGTQTQVGDYPTVVAIEIAPGALCTGTLIHPEWVLTAAHCVTPSVIGLANQAAVTAATKVRIDSITAFTGGGRLIAAADTIPNPGFSIQNLGDNDIGLIKLSERVDDRMVTRLNRSAAAAPVGVNVDFVGFGKTSAGSFGREYELLDRNSVSCALVGASDTTLLCFDQTDGRGQCQGDSGGPTFADIDGVATVVGITSFGDENCQYFGAETRVDAEVTFVDQQIGPSIRCVHDGVCADGCAGADRDEDCPPCANDDECGDDLVCDAGGSCVPAPFTEGGLGFPCVDASECATGACQTIGDQQLCTSSCEGNDDCPTGFECTVIYEGEPPACWPHEGGGGGGGCATSGDSRGLLATLLAVFGLVGITGRRRRR